MQLRSAATFGLAILVPGAAAGTSSTASAAQRRFLAAAVDDVDKGALNGTAAADDVGASAAVGSDAYVDRVGRFLVPDVDPEPQYEEYMKDCEKRARGVTMTFNKAYIKAAVKSLLYVACSSHELDLSKDAAAAAAAKTYGTCEDFAENLAEARKADLKGGDQKGYADFCAARFKRSSHLVAGGSDEASKPETVAKKVKAPATARHHSKDEHEKEDMGAEFADDNEVAATSNAHMAAKKAEKKAEAKAALRHHSDKDGEEDMGDEFESEAQFEDDDEVAAPPNMHMVAKKAAKKAKAKAKAAARHNSDEDEEDEEDDMGGEFESEDEVAPPSKVRLVAKKVPKKQKGPAAPQPHSRDDQDLVSQDEDDAEVEDVAETTGDDLSDDIDSAGEAVKTAWSDAAEGEDQGEPQELRASAGQDMDAIDDDREAAGDSAKTKRWLAAQARHHAAVDDAEAAIDAADAELDDAQGDDYDDEEQ